MITLNYNYLEKLISESKMDQKVLAREMGLSEKFFSRLRENGSNLNVSDLCIIAEYFDANIEDFITTDSANNVSETIRKGRKLFSKYYDYEEKAKTMLPPDAAGYKSSWLSDIGNNSTYMNSPELRYLEENNSYKNTIEIYNTMNEVLISVVCQLDPTYYDVELIREDLLSFLTYGIREISSGIGRTKLVSLANKACVGLANEVEFKKLF